MIGSGEEAGESTPLSRLHLYSFERLWRAYRECRRNKRNTINASAFAIDAEAKLLELQREVREMGRLEARCAGRRVVAFYVPVLTA